jgi:tripartite ATP-independent transporter DctP family solute receptor
MKFYLRNAVVILVILATTAMVGCTAAPQTQSQTTEAATTQAAANKGNTGATAKSNEVYSITFAHHQQVDSPIGLGCDRLAKTLNEKSGGRLNVKVYPAEQLGNEKSVFEQLTEGVADMSTLGFGIIGTMSPSSLAMEMGYMFENYDHLANFLNSDVFQQIVQDAVSKSGIRIGSAYYNGTRHTTTSKKPVTNPESMKGVKLRVPNSDMLLATFQAMGCSPTPMAFSEVYMALQRGSP